MHKNTNSECFYLILKGHHFSFCIWPLTTTLKMTVLSALWQYDKCYTWLVLPHVLYVMWFVSAFYILTFSRYNLCSRRVVTLPSEVRLMGYCPKVIFFVLDTCMPYVSHSYRFLICSVSTAVWRGARLSKGCSQRLS